MTLTPGQTIGAYRIVEQVGRGGMATVYKAHQAALARFVAVKVLPAYLAQDEGFTERFRSEAVTIAKLRHPNILQVFDYGEENGLHYLVSEFVDGGTLADQIGAPLPLDYVLRMLAPIASALDYAHARDVVHRDVKPSNVLLARDGTPVLSDFGLARMMMGALPRLTQTGAVVGTPEYMAPEQAVGEDASGAADRYALAVIAYEMLTGAVPFSADTPLATLLAHAHKPLPLPREKNPQLSPAVEAVLLKGLAKDPADRYATARELVAALEAPAAASIAASAPSERPAPAPAAAAPAAGPLATPSIRAGVFAPRRNLIVGVVAAGLIVVAGITATATGVIGGPPRASSAQASGRPAIAIRGALLWEASLDARGSDVGTPPAISNTAAAALRSAAGSLECAILQQGGQTGSGIGKSHSAPYFAELDLSVQAPPTFIFTWSLRTSQQGTYLVRVDAAAGSVGRLQFGFRTVPAASGASASPAAPSLDTLLPAPIILEGWGSGKQFTFAAAVRADRYTLFVDGQQVADLKGDRVPGSTANPLGVSCGGPPGTAKITGLRVYVLNSP